MDQVGKAYFIKSLSGKKNTKIYKAEHLPTGKIYAIKEVEAKTLDKLNEYKVIAHLSLRNNFRKKQYNSTKYRLIRTYCSSLDITSTRLCTTLTELRWYVNTWSLAKI